MIDDEKTARTKVKWDRNAGFYDFMTRLMEGKKAKAWYASLWQGVSGPKVMEVGVGTGRSFEYHPAGIQVTAIDLSSGMLTRAKRKARRIGLSVDMRQMDVQKLDFPDAKFDSVVAACTFCSVPDPVLGLSEVGRVLRPGGRVFLLEHMRHDNPFLGKLMDWANPLVVRLVGPAINRRTLDNIRNAGLQIESVQDMALGGILKLIVATRPWSPALQPCWQGADDI